MRKTGLITLLLYFFLFHICYADDQSTKVEYVQKSSMWIEIKSGAEHEKIDTANLEIELWNYLSKNTTYTFQSKKQYKYQYKVLNDGNIFINAFCSHMGVDYEWLSSNIYIAKDGGSCFFQIYKNIRTQKFHSLNINGES